MTEGKEFKNWLAERIKDRHAVHTARRVIAKEKGIKISSGYHVKDAYVFILTIDHFYSRHGNISICSLY